MAEPPGDVASLVVGLLRDVPDHPRPGVVFKDITPLLGDPGAFSAVIAALADMVRASGPIDAIAGIEARGFIFGAPLALALGVAFVPVRKAGKLPHDTHSVSYDLEYGSAQIEVHVDALGPGQRVVVVDDVLATGGTAAAACGLIEATGAQVQAVAVLIELGFLGGRQNVSDRPVHALVTV